MKLPRPIRPLTDAQRALASAPEHIALADAIARGYGRVLAWLSDDIRAAALLGLCDAVQRYRPEQGPFAQYAPARVRGAIRDELRKQGAAGFIAPRGACPKVISLSFRPPGDDTPELAEVLVSEDLPNGWELASEDEVRALVATLPEPQANALLAYFTRAGITMLQLGQELGVCEGSVSRMLAKGLEELRRRAVA